MNQPFSADLSYGRRLWLLFFTFAKIAALVVGGGLAMLPVIEETFVNKYKLLSREELLDMVTVTQTVPGIIAVNSAIYTGMKVAGPLGAICAVFGAVLPSFTVIVIIAACVPTLDPKNPFIAGAFRGVRGAVTGLILVTACRIWKKSAASRFDRIAILVFLFLAIAGINPALLILAAMPMGLIRLRLEEKTEKRS